jgi:hypothetical protein
MMVDKASIIAALTEEKYLEQGRFIDIPNSASFAKAKTAPCGVCAVGAVLRRSLPPMATVWDLDQIACNNVYGSLVWGDPMESVAKGDWISALSLVFEQAPRQSRRKKALAFVQEHFPEEIEIHIQRHIVKRWGMEGYADQA